MEPIRITLDPSVAAHNFLKRFPEATEQDAEDLIWLLVAFGKSQEGKG
jgi:hypothetical protein